MGVPAHIIEGRWYGELKRTRTYGAGHDWRTMLSRAVQEQLERGDKSLDVVDRAIVQFTSQQEVDVSVFS